MTEIKKYIMPSPKGAYYLIQDKSESWQKNVLKKLFSFSQTPELNSETLKIIFDTPVLSVDDKINLEAKISDFQKMKLIQVMTQPVNAPDKLFEQNLNDLFNGFSDNHKVLLSDSQGFSIANHGFPAEMIEEISVLSADIAIMHERRAININKKLGLNSQAWSIVDSNGASCLGFWPLDIANEVFVLAIQGAPIFNKSAFTYLVWILYLKYGKNQ